MRKSIQAWETACKRLRGQRGTKRGCERLVRSEAGSGQCASVQRKARSVGLRLPVCCLRKPGAVDCPHQCIGGLARCPWAATNRERS